MCFAGAPLASYSPLCNEHCHMILKSSVSSTRLVATGSQSLWLTHFISSLCPCLEETLRNSVLAWFLRVEFRFCIYIIHGVSKDIGWPADCCWLQRSGAFRKHLGCSKWAGKASWNHRSRFCKPIRNYWARSIEHWNQTWKYGEYVLMKES